MNKKMFCEIDTWRLDFGDVHGDADEEDGVGEGRIDAPVKRRLPLLRKPGADVIKLFSFVTDGAAGRKLPHICPW